MKGLIFLLMIPAMAGCQFYAETSEPVLYLGGGKWTFSDYEIVPVNYGYPVNFALNDTICLDLPAFVRETPEGIVADHGFVKTALNRRFVRGRTLWEFDGYNLYCHFISDSGRIIFSREPFWVTFPDPFYTGHTLMEVTDYTSEERTLFTFAANNAGVAPPDTMLLGSPEISVDIYSPDGVKGSRLTYRVYLTFIR